MKFDKQKVMKVLPFIILGYFFNKVSQAFTSAAGTELGDKIMNGMDGLGEVFLNPLPSFNPIDLLIGVAGGVIVKLVIYVKGKNAKKYRKGCEYGSARWGNAEDIKPYMADKFEDNVILTETERLTMDGRPKAGPKYARNKNILVIGGSGSGKTRFYVKPNLLQMHSSYVVTDPKGTVLNEVGKALQDGGYAIKVLNTINFKKSMHYNPLAYIRSEKDILKLVNTIIANTKGEGSQSGEDFWVKAERLYYQTIENKQRFISQIMSSKSPVRSCEDVDEATLSYAEVKALCAGNPLIKEKMDLDVAVTKLKVSKANHTSQQYTIEDSVRKHFPERIAKTEQRIAGLEADLAHFKAQPDVTEGISPMTILNKTFTDKEEAGKALLLACKQIKSKENLEIGSYKGFDMSLSYDSFAQEFHLELQREMSYTVTLGTSESGNILRIDNALDSIEKRIENSKEQLETLNEQLSTAKAELGKPFPQEAELTEKLARLAELNTLLNIDENAIENAAVAAEKKPDIPISADEVKPMRNVFPERKTSILDRIKEMQSAQAGNIPKEKTPTKDKTSEIS